MFDALAHHMRHAYQVFILAFLAGFLEPFIANPERAL
jgi:hypothetical protein